MSIQRIPKKSPPYTSSHYSSLELFTKMFEIFEKGKTFFKEQNVGKEMWRIFLGIFLLCVCFFFGFLPPHGIFIIN
jgi:hypothetical protein